jgi:hypothetical protein
VSTSVGRDRGPNAVTRLDQHEYIAIRCIDQSDAIRVTRSSTGVIQIPGANPQSLAPDLDFVMTGDHG